MIRLLPNIRIFVCALCLMMMASAVTLDAHEINEEISSEQVEIELEELLIENRQGLVARSKKASRSKGSSAAFGLSDKRAPSVYRGRNFLSRSLRTERAFLNGIGAILRN